MHLLHDVRQTCCYFLMLPGRLNPPQRLGSSPSPFQPCSPHKAAYALRRALRRSWRFLAFICFHLLSFLNSLLAAPCQRVAGCCRCHLVCNALPVGVVSFHGLSCKGRWRDRGNRRGNFYKYPTLVFGPFDSDFTHFRTPLISLHSDGNQTE